MATITDSGFPTLVEAASRLDPNGNPAIIADVLEKKSGLIRDLPFFEGNKADGHEIDLTSVAAPDPAWRVANNGVIPTKNYTEKYTETCGLLEDHSVIDEAVMERLGGVAYRDSEDRLKLKRIPEFFTKEFFYESVTDNPAAVHGLAPRFPASTGYDTSPYVKIGTNGGSNCHSVWLITPEERKVYGTYPRGTSAGLKRIVEPDRKLFTGANGGQYFGYITQYKWHVGIAVEDFRYVVRFQWDPDDAEMAAGERGLIEGILDMQDIIQDITPNTRYYMDRTTIRRMKTQLRANESRLLTWITEPSHRMPGDPGAMGGQRMRELDGVPLRLEDALVAETAVA